MADVQLSCDGCGKVFSRKKGEYNRSQKLGRKNWCSLNCQGKNNYHLTIYGKQNYKFLEEYWKLHTKTDEFSEFRYHIKNMWNHIKQHASKKTSRVLECTVTLSDLKNQWDKQKGLCPYSGIKMIPSTTQRNVKHPHRASLDRIDSSKGYTPDNIQFICMMAQFAKNSWTSKEMIDFCKQVSYNNREDNEEHF